MRISILFPMLGALILAQPVAAGERIPGDVPVHGAETREWLRLQAGGGQAAPSPQQPGEAASRAYQRYLKSFEQPIPDSVFGTKKGFVGE